MCDLMSTLVALVCYNRCAAFYKRDVAFLIGKDSVVHVSLLVKYGSMCTKL